MKKIILIALSLCLLFCFSCSKKARDDISTENIAIQVSEHMENYSEMEQCSQIYLSEVFGIDTENSVDYVAMRSIDARVDQFCIIKTKDEKTAKELCQEVKEKIGNLSREWDGRYFPEENEKIASAGAIYCGRYVLVTVLSDVETRNVQSQFKNIIYS